MRKILINSRSEIEKATIDSAVNAVYVQFYKSKILKTVPCTVKGGGTLVNIDIGYGNKVVGIEVISPKELSKKKSLLHE